MENLIIVAAVDPATQRQTVHVSALGFGVLCDAFRKPIPVDGMERRQRPTNWWPFETSAEVSCPDCLAALQWHEDWQESA